MNSVNPTMPHAQRIPAAPPGTVVSVDRGLYRHFGILTEPQLGRERHVISLNPEAQLAEEPLSLFCRGQQLE